MGGLHSSYTFSLIESSVAQNDLKLKIVQLKICIKDESIHRQPLLDFLRQANNSQWQD